jgi:hypothetical protein
MIKDGGLGLSATRPLRPLKVARGAGDGPYRDSTLSLTVHAAHALDDAPPAAAAGPAPGANAGSPTGRVNSGRKPGLGAGRAARCWRGLG